MLSSAYYASIIGICIVGVSQNQDFDNHLHIIDFAEDDWYKVSHLYSDKILSVFN